MKTLIFDLLHRRARSAGCADEAWEIVGEFAAAETLLERVANSGAPYQWDVAGSSCVAAAEALLSCLSARDSASFDWDDDDEDDEWNGDDDEDDDDLGLGITAPSSIYPGSN